MMLLLMVGAIGWEQQQGWHRLQLLLLLLHLIRKL
jgi:hypothetical protein